MWDDVQLSVMTDATTVFDQHARDYDALRRRLVPAFDEFYSAALEALTLATRPLARVLDLGAGTGLLAAMVARAQPDAEIVLLDGAGEMLAQARERLGDRASYVTADLGDTLPDGPWDGVISALAIHHLDDAGKRDLFARVHDALAPGGVFVNAEQILGPTPELDARYLSRHREQALALGASVAEWDAALARMSHDRCATVADQLGWLRDAGFVEVDAPWRDGRFAVLAGRRAS
jgi:tRNA (cmo5U34)-methyltransferase